jgi:hypothetical protein
MGIFVPLVLCALSVLFPQIAAAQDLETIADEKPLTLTGPISATITAYSANGPDEPFTDQGRSPFSWLIEGAPTLSLFGIQVPFSFIISEQEREFRQPFDQYGLSPTYKSFTAHLGYRNMNFSRFTLAGHTFLGGGFEFKPGILRLQAMYGRFQRAVQEDTSRFDVEPAYERIGYAVKAGIGGQRDFVDLNMLYAADDSSSLTSPLIFADILPAENLVLGLNSRIDILNEGSTTLSIEGEGAASVFTRDARAPKYTASPIPEGIHKIFRITEATSFNFASQAALAFRIPEFQARINWERIEPEYQSLGTYYILTDLERWTFAPTVSLMESKLRLSTSIGLEHDNLLEERARTTNRLIGSGAISYNPSSKFGVDLNYSNYTTEQKRALTRVDLRDTLPDGSLRLTHNVSQSITVAPRFVFQDAEGDEAPSLNQIISFVAAYQEYQDQTEGIGDLADSKALTASINYNRAYLQLGRTIGGSIIFSRAQAGISKVLMLGGSVTGSMSMLEEKALTLSASLGATSSSISTVDATTFSLNETLNGSYKASERNIFTLSVYASQNSGYETAFGVQEGNGELTATLSYSHLLDF